MRRGFFAERTHLAETWEISSKQWNMWEIFEVDRTPFSWCWLAKKLSTVFVCIFAYLNNGSTSPEERENARQNEKNLFSTFCIFLCNLLWNRERIMRGPLSFLMVIDHTLWIIYEAAIKGQRLLSNYFHAVNCNQLCFVRFSYTLHN